MRTELAVARDLEPAAGRALRDHLRKAREWDSDDLRPRGRILADRAGIRSLAPPPESDPLFFPDVTTAAPAPAPDAAVTAVAEVVTDLRPPHAALPGFGREAAIFAAYGGYDSTVHQTEGLVPTLRTWRVFDREPGPARERARGALREFLVAAELRAGAPAVAG